ncbi:MAG TPA: hypothetical protein VFF33_08620 [Ignavibacteriaceae bacterium]|nr:hypothetical protein [Ignavibacteriaceae bacterium]
MFKKIPFLLLSLSFLAFINTPDDDKKITKKVDDDNSKYMNIGNVGLTVTNFGTYGHGFSLWPEQPSAEYPINSGIEHIFDGGLWIGGFISNDSLGNGRTGPFVTTGAVDAASVSARGGGFEYTNLPGSKIIERSSLLTSKFYSPDAVSHQDLIADYTDTSMYLSNGELIEGHVPLGLSVHQESYAWNYPFADFFVLMNYTIKNVSNKYVDSIYIGLWTDAVVRNTNVTSPRTGGTFFSKGGDGYADTLKIAYEFDAAGDVGFSDSYIGVQFLGSTPALPEIVYLNNDTVSSVNFNCWQFRNTQDPNLFAPQVDVERYEKMQGYFGGTNRYGKGINPNDLKQPSNRSIMITAGPYITLAPGDSVNIVYSFTFAKKFGTDPNINDTPEQKKNLYSNASWALRAYYGEDRNRNNQLDAGEDQDGNGKITRYILPAPPTTPRVKVVPENQKVVIYWDKSAELSEDPISGKKDFEGYKVYRTNAGFDLNRSQDVLSSMFVAAEFDSTGNSVGYNTGFGYTALSEPKKFEGDPNEYWYKFEVDNLLNGWQYVFSVTAFDEGDAENNLGSLESSMLANSARIIPGTPATDDKEVGVYPNPYYGNAYWDGGSERLRKIYFNNLPADCDITIYTLSGDVIKRMHHTSESNGAEYRWFETYSKAGDQKMSGGEQAWDLITDSDQAIATGLYLFSVKNNKTGDIKTGKFLIVK